MDYLEKLYEFHIALYKKTGLEYNAPKYGLNSPAHALRINLMEEEMGELVDAMDDFMYNGGSLENVRKELCDVLYVVFGTAVVLGLPVEQDFELVHQNNMLKIATGTVREDGKLVKPKDHPKVELPL